MNKALREVTMFLTLNMQVLGCVQKETVYTRRKRENYMNFEKLMNNISRSITFTKSPLLDETLDVPLLDETFNQSQSLKIVHANLFGCFPTSSCS